ncbi:MAG: VWA domain-containing protein, partial [Elusimicrobia bacterium]|nr:VWA domain-containing protein [Elusimicrobiota bacterium]
SMYGALDFYAGAKKAGLKPILGCEVYVARGSRFTKEQGPKDKEAKDAAAKSIPKKGGSKAWGFALPLAFAATGVTFSNPVWIAIAAVLVPALGGLLFYFVLRDLKLAKSAAPATAAKDFKNWWGRPRFWTKTALTVTAASLLAFALADPKGGMRQEVLNFGGKDVTVALDASASMRAAEDGRMDAARAELTRFLRKMQGTDRVGLVIFADNARTASPPSIDYGNFEFKIDRVDLEGSRLSQGSNLASAIQQSVKSFEAVKKIGDRERIIIVISDGDVPAEQIDQAIAIAKKAGVTVYAIGVGDTKGVRMVVPAEAGDSDSTGAETAGAKAIAGAGAGVKQKEYVQDEAGNPALTKLNEATLQKLASSTGGAYFRATKGTSIDKILERVAANSNGDKQDTIKSPHPVASVFLWPALMLLLLDLLLPSDTMLRRRTSREPKAPKASTDGANNGGSMLMGGLTMASWAQVWPYGLIATGVLGAILADVWFGRKISRGLLWWGGRVANVTGRGLDRDLASLFELREADEPAVREFLAKWRKADSKTRPALLAEASNDPLLWREKLVAAVLAGGGEEAEDAALAAIASTNRGRLESVHPFVLRLLTLREKTAWLDHVDSARRLARLAQAGLDVEQKGSVTALRKLATFPDEAVSQSALDLLGESLPPAPKTSWHWRRVLAAALSVQMLLGTVGVTGYSAYESARYSQQQEVARQQLLKDVFREDAIIFADHYRDPLIESEVLPALRRWDESGRGSRRDFEKAVKILRESADPKADVVLEAIFKRADLLPLSDEAETMMLTALIERDNEQMWTFLNTYLQQPHTQATVVRLQKMIAIAGAIGSDQAFHNIFIFLKSPVREIKGQAASAIYGSLATKDGGAKFFERLETAQTKFAGDPALQLWIETFLLRRAADPNAKLDDARAHSILDRVFVLGKPMNEMRAKLFEKAKPDEEEDIPAAYVVAALGRMSSAIEASSQNGAKPT